jgi:O-antigen/teichoic acid export membrane protein
MIDAESISVAAPQPRLQRFANVAGRYGISAAGPISISAAHFIASLIFLRAFAPAAFGLFSFALVIVPLCLSMSAALLGAPVATAITRGHALSDHELASLMKANFAFSFVAGIVIAALLFASGAEIPLAALLGVYGGAMTLRWFARSYAYTKRAIARVAASDFSYSVLLTASLATLLATHTLTPANAALAMGASIALALLPFGTTFLKQQIASLFTGTLGIYRAIWRDLTRWSLLGVVATELTANAHAYLVTFISGPKAFALLAVGSLFMRPVSLCLSALPDLERPAMARKIAAGHATSAYRHVREFRAAAIVIWLCTIVLSVVVMHWFPTLILKHGYDARDVSIVVVLWATIMAVRLLRTPESVLLQAAREFRPLAGASLWSSVVSLALTLGLLLVAGPIASLCGILAGDLVMTAKILVLARKWRAQHG